ncbi:MAG: hypothetical protein ACXWRP_07725 [Bdellovibrio sp.]
MVKLLAVIYMVSLYNGTLIAVKPEVTNKMSLVSILLPVILNLTFLIIIVYRVSWAWLAGICESFYYASVSIYLLIEGKGIALRATEAALSNPKLPNQLTPEQMQLGMNIGLYGSAIFLIVGALSKIFLWHRSRFYFERKPINTNYEMQKNSTNHLGTVFKFVFGLILSFGLLLLGYRSYRKFTIGQMVDKINQCATSGDCYDTTTKECSPYAKGANKICALPRSSE